MDCRIFCAPRRGAGADRARDPYSYNGNTRNFYAQPIEGVVAHVNLTTGKILELLDTDRNLPIPREPAEIAAAFNLPLREPLPPLNITQPNGPGFRIEDGEVRWQKWRFRWALHPREGLVLYAVGYEDGGTCAPGDVSRVAFGNGGSLRRPSRRVVLPQ